MRMRISLFCIALTICSSTGRSQWIQTAAPNTWIDCLVAKGTNLFVGCANGVFRSSDNGASWTAVNNGLTDPVVDALVISGTSLFAGTQSGYVYRSADSGSTWKSASLGLPYDRVLALAENGSSLFAGTSYQGVFRSSDNGASWLSASTGLTDTHAVRLAVNGTHLFAGTFAGVFLSTNDGTSWAAVNTGLSETRVSSLAVCGTNLYVWSSNSAFCSTNDGESWTATNNGLLSNSVVLAFAGSGTNVFAGGVPGGIFLSTNGGTNWTDVNTGLLDTHVRTLVVNGSYLFAGTQGSGVWRRPLSEMIGASAVPVHAQAQAIVGQSYPNPFSQSTTIWISLGQGGFTEVTVVNLLGTEVARLFEGELEAGRHSFVWNNLPGLPDGVYECLTRVNGQVEKVPIMLLR